MAGVQDVCDLSGLLQSEERHREDLEKQKHLLQTSLSQQQGRLEREVALSQQLKELQEKQRGDVKNLAEHLELLQLAVSQHSQDYLAPRLHNDIEARVDAYISEKNSLLNAIRSLEEAIHKLGRDVSSCFQELRKLTVSEESKVLLTELEISRGVLKEAKMTKEAVDMSITSTRREVEDCKLCCDNLRAKQRDLKAKLSDVRKELDDLHSESEDLTRSLLSLKNKNHREEEELRSAITQSQNQMDTVRQEMQSISVASATFRAEIEEMSANLNEVRERTGVAECAGKELISKLSAIKVSISELETRKVFIYKLHILQLCINTTR